MDSPPLYVVDANVLIDLHIGQLLEEFFRLPFQLLAPDVIIAELQDPDGKKLLGYGLQSRELSGEQVMEVGSLAAAHRRVSTNDLFALVLARGLKVPLLTGDRYLARIGAQAGVVVHGTLWILDELVRLEVIAPAQAAAGLRRMLARGSRLPQVECQRRLKRWGAR